VLFVSPGGMAAGKTLGTSATTGGSLKIEPIYQQSLVAPSTGVKTFHIRGATGTYPTIQLAGGSAETEGYEIAVEPGTNQIVYPAAPRTPPAGHPSRPSTSR
jgi:hypothetical protein